MVISVISHYGRIFFSFKGPPKLATLLALMDWAAAATVVPPSPPAATAPVIQLTTIGHLAKRLWEGVVDFGTHECTHQLAPLISVSISSITPASPASPASLFSTSAALSLFFATLPLVFATMVLWSNPLLVVHFQLRACGSILCRCWTVLLDCIEPLVWYLNRAECCQQ